MLLNIPTYILCGVGAEDGDEHAGRLAAFQSLSSDPIVLHSASKTRFVLHTRYSLFGS